MSLRNRWSSRTSPRIASGSWSRCHRHSRRPALAPSPPAAANRQEPGARDFRKDHGRTFITFTRPASYDSAPLEGEAMAIAKNTVCLWYDRDAEAAARFYAATFPDSAVGAVRRAPSDYPSGKEGDVLMVQFTVLGIPCLGLNGGPMFKHNEAFSFQIATEDQEETDRYWSAIVGNGGQESQGGGWRGRGGIFWEGAPPGAARGGCARRGGGKGGLPCAV